ncbi:hypothetical protein EOE18_17790 [Novosphingobium umbonatum]|uniref:Uncharacterized protein n=1 Tax=Novosphingobium umbonatum TaxID=1908524 RepID=A0A3S2UNM0_9SPHN|nr:hypothetical protein EOE18_17790 [Novosphingobium umbonatum]
MQVATHLFEAAAWHQALKPVCACGHSASFDPHGLWWHFERRGWEMQIYAIRKRFWCLMCLSETRKRRNPQRIDLVPSSNVDIRLPMPPERVWKRESRRMR